MSNRGVNKAIIVGSLGADPEVRQLNNGGNVVTVSVATSEEWLNKKTMGKEKQVEWHRVTFFNKLGEIAAQYLKKGSQVYIEGKIKTRKWQAQDGSDRYSTEIVANEMQMLGGKAEQATTGFNANAGQHSAEQPSKSSPAPQPDPFDDDIPF